jgi:tRNA pseudouridine32 synthase/23S rRNA pseudouridine746 synthase
VHDGCAVSPARASLRADKPPGLPFHADADGPGVLQVARAAQASGALGDYTGRLYAVHRLDRGTSGVLLLAKSSADAGLLGALFRRGDVRKYYVALSSRRPSRKMGEVVGDLAPARRGAYMLLRTRERPAATRFTSSGVVGGRPGLRGFVLRPLTGRTHQLRVAMKSLGAPVLGDALYAAAADTALEERCYLHAAALALPPLAPGEAPLCVVCAPSAGAEFVTPHFRAWFDARFPPGAAPEAWCAGDPQLTAPPRVVHAWHASEAAEEGAEDAAWQ